MGSGPIIILTALRSEGAAIARRMGLRRISAGRYRSESEGTELLVIGPAAATLPLEAPDTSLVIVAGLAGGLDPDLCSGDVVVDGLPEGLELDLDVGGRGRIVTAAGIVATPLEKGALFAATGASVVEMEQQRVVEAWPGARVMGVRVVLDTAEEAISPRLAALVDSRGAVRASAVVRMAICSPRTLGKGARLGRRASEILPWLAAAVASITAAIRRA